MTAPPVSSWSKQEICLALGISRRAIDRLIREGKVNYIRAGRSQRFLAEHVGQITASLEVKPKPVTDTTFLGLSPQAAARRRNRIAS